MARFIILASLCFCLISLKAQPTFRELTGVDAWLNTSVELYFSGHSNLVFSGTVQRSSFAGDRLGNSPFDETLLSIGYQHFLQEKWLLQFSQKRNRIITGRRDISSAAIQHNGKIESLIFLKTANVEFIQFKDDVNKEDDFRVSASVYLGKRVDVKQIPLQIGLRYEIFRDINPSGDPRRVSKSRLWFDSQLFISNHANLGFFAMRETDYFFAEETFGLDDDGNLVTVKPYRKLNLFTPTYGIRLRFIIAPENIHPSLPFNFYRSK